MEVGGSRFKNLCKIRNDLVDLKDDMSVELVTELDSILESELEKFIFDNTDLIIEVHIILKKSTKAPFQIEENKIKGS